MLTDMQCYCGVIDNTSVWFCPRSPPFHFVNGGYLWVKSCNHILPQQPEMTTSGLSEASEMMTQRDKVSWSLGSPSASREQWSISSCTLYLRCRLAGTELVCLASIWPPVTERRPVWCLLPLHCLCWKTKTPALLNSIVLTKKRTWQCRCIWYRLLKITLAFYAISACWHHWWKNTLIFYFGMVKTTVLYKYIYYWIAL